MQKGYNVYISNQWKMYQTRIGDRHTITQVTDDCRHVIIKMVDLKVAMQSCVNPLLTEKNAPKHCMLGYHWKSEFTTTE